MRYRQLGSTGMTVSEIGMGCEGFLGKSQAEYTEWVDIMEEQGINCIDMYTSDPDFRTKLGTALKGRREKFILEGHLCSIWENGQYLRTREMEKVRAGFEEQLRLLQTDYLDIGMIHYCDDVEEWKQIAEGPVMEYAKQLRSEGRIRCIGLSTHNPAVGMLAARGGEVKVILFSVNPCYDLLPADTSIDAMFESDTYNRDFLNMDPARAAFYETCQSLGVGITVMKAFAGGDMLSEDSPAGLALTVNQCLHYALSRPAVASVMAGARSAGEIRSAAAYEDASEEEKDYAAAFAKMNRISWKGHCMYCGHCAPCPMEISVANVTKFLNLALAQGSVPETVREHYAALEHHASECAECGACEERCPFGVAVIENMRKAAEVFGY